MVVVSAPTWLLHKGQQLGTCIQTVASPKRARQSITCTCKEASTARAGNWMQA